MLAGLQAERPLTIPLAGMKHTYVRLAIVFILTVLISDVEFTRGINLSLCQVDIEQYRN